MELKLKEAAKSAASGLEGSQGGIRFPAIRQRSFVIDNIEKEFGNGDPSKRRSVVETADDFCTENPKVVGMFRDDATGKPELDQMIEEGPEARQELLTGSDVFGKAHPSVWPLVEILATVEIIQRENGLRPVWGVRYGRSFLLPLLDNHGIDYDSKPVLPVFGICV